MTTIAYTDGACLGNPGPGGWAWVVDGGPYASGAEAHTTNQRMEITAAHEAVQALDGPLVVVSDSTYVVKCFNDRWWQGWIARDWKNSKKEPVANRDLWEPFIDAVRTRGDVEFRWVKGHSGDRMNDAADKLATTAAGEQRGSRGDAFGEAVVAGLKEDPIDVVRTHGVVVTGLRPPGLGGYDENDTQRAVRARIREILAAKRAVDSDVVAVTGLGLGSEQLGAEAAIEADVAFIAVLPYPDPETVWPDASQRRFRDLLARAYDTVTLSAKKPASKVDAGRAIGRRDQWLAQHAREAIVVWDEQDANVGRLVRDLEQRLDDVWIVTP